MLLKFTPFFLLFCLVFGAPISGKSQSDEKVIIIVPFYAKNRQYNAAADQVYSYAMTEFVKSRRARFVEREKFSQIELEKMINSGDDFNPLNVIDIDQSIGGTHLLIGKINSCDTERKRRDSGDTYYTCNIQTSIRVVNIETGEIEMSDDWESGGLLPITASSEEGAVAKASKSQRRDASKFLDEFFPLVGSIKKVISDDEFIVGLGRADGVNEKDILEVFTVEDMGGDPFYTLLGSIKVTEVNGPSLCTAKLKGTERGQPKDCISMAVHSRKKIIVKTKQ